MGVDYNGPNDFVHLNVHTVFSELMGVAQPDKYASKASKYGHSAIAVSEHGNVSSVPDMYFACKKNKLKYIPACELYWNDFEPLRREFAASDTKPPEKLIPRISRNRYLTVLCKNDTGFSNLIKMTTIAHKIGFYHKPRVWMDQLIKFKEGLIVLSGGLNGPVAHELFLDIDTKELEGKPYVRIEHEKSAVDYLRIFKEEFGDDFYIEMRMPCMPEIYDDKIFWLLNALGKKYGIKRVLTNSCYYTDYGDHEVQRMMVAIDQGTNIYDPNLRFADTDQQWYKTRAELYQTFKENNYCKNVSDEDFDEMCDVTVQIADKCSGLKPDTSLKIPDWGAIEVGTNADDELRRLVSAALASKGLDKITKRYMIDGVNVTYVEQAEIECERFISKGFASYFLITQDLITYGKAKGWPFGPRGSAGGSLVCYLLNIHNIDPLKWGLSFDRFMASSRGGYLLNVQM